MPIKEVAQSLGSGAYSESKELLDAESCEIQGSNAHAWQSPDRSKAFYFVTTAAEPRPAECPDTLCRDLL